MATVKVQKGNTIKEIPEAYKGDYIAAGWREANGTAQTKATENTSYPYGTKR